MPVGFKQRLAPEFLSKVYSVPGRTGVDYATIFLQEHGADTCNLAKGMVDAMSCIDNMLFIDRTPDLVNLISTEYLCRKAYGFELAFLACKEKSDWHKPAKAGAGWTSKIDWEMWRRIDPGAQPDMLQGDFLTGVKEEVKSEMSRDADLLKVKLKLSDRSEHKDLFNP